MVKQGNQEKERDTSAFHLSDLLNSYLLTYTLFYIQYQGSRPSNKRLQLDCGPAKWIVFVFQPSPI